MDKVAQQMTEKGITRVDDGAVLVDFTELVPGKEGKRLGKTVIRYEFSYCIFLGEPPSVVNSLTAHF